MQIQKRESLKPPNTDSPIFWIKVEEAREHNLKGINVKVPKNRFVVITGLSGSGKSSLAIDTLFVEGQRRFVESLSSYARQFLGQMEKPHVKSISGLSPAICIEQKSASHNPRSTVATVTEIMDYLRLLYSSICVPHCPTCGKEVKGLSAEEMVDHVLDLPEGSKVRIISPVVKNEKGTFKKLFQNLRKQGYIRLEVNGQEVNLDDGIPTLDKSYRHYINIVLDRMVLKSSVRSQLTSSVEMALEKSNGELIIDIVDRENPRRIELYEYAGCPTHGFSISELAPRMFSFNNPMGACQECMGLGVVMEMDPDLLIPDKSLSIREGAILSVKANEDSWQMQGLNSVLTHYGYNLDTPIEELPKKVLKVVLYGSGSEKIKFEKEMESKDGSSTWMYSAEKPTEGIIKGLRRRHRQTSSDGMRRYYEQFMSEKACTSCNGLKLQPAPLGVLVGEKNIMQLSNLSVSDALNFFESLDLTDTEKQITEQILKEIKSRLSFLASVGLDYLTLDRKASTLSGGEAQRIRLATQIGSRLTGVMYVLDEPSIGLHQKDNKRLLETFFELRDLGNTVIVIEHDEETIRSADYIIDMGPLAGINGGEVIAAGTPTQILESDSSLTAKYLRNEMFIETPARRRVPRSYLTIKGAEQNNLKSIDVDIPMGVFTVVTGVSGSGKSTLIYEILWKALSRYVNGSKERPGKHKKIEGMNTVDKVIMINQKPIGRTPRSNPATYTKVFDEIRKIFAQVKEAKIRGYKPGRFSFNVKGGRCEPCNGNGYNKIEMSFLSDVYVECDVCNGKRFNRETLEVEYKGKDIAEVLAMDIEEASKFFENVPKIKRILDTLLSVGCGYIKLGQSATTLSGGESQRIKLSRELSKRTTKNTVILLDEPSTGLHMHDVRKLLEVLHRLVQKGNTILTIEHNLDIIRNADYIIDLGPEGGDKGGNLVAIGTPEEVAEFDDSYTGRYLKEIFIKEGKKIGSGRTLKKRANGKTSKKVSSKSSGKKGSKSTERKSKKSAKKSIKKSEELDGSTKPKISKKKNPKKS